MWGMTLLTVKWFLRLKNHPTGVAFEDFNSFLGRKLIPLHSGIIQYGIPRIWEHKEYQKGRTARRIQALPKHEPKWELEMRKNWRKMRGIPRITHLEIELKSGARQRCCHACQLIGISHVMSQTIWNSEWKFIRALWKVNEYHEVWREISDQTQGLNTFSSCTWESMNNCRFNEQHTAQHVCLIITICLPGRDVQPL